MKVVIFGGSGFLGSHVADILTEKGHKVTIFDKDRSKYLLPSQKMVVGDILDKAAVMKAAKDTDIIYNFAALSDIELSCEKPSETAEVNIIGNINALEAARENKVKRFVFSSSIYVYSDMGSFYRSSKQSCELFIEDYHQEFGLDYTILRYGSLYGLRCDETNWIYRTLKQALLEGKIIREGDGEEIREYIHVVDAAKLSVDILDEKFKNRKVIIAGNEPFKIKDLLVMIKEILKGKVKIEYVKAKKNLHYEMTPYVFKPQIASKIFADEYLDLGQGILNILDELHSKHVIKGKKV
ncbi:MAG: NAD(P)-dependent oxidoreductase [Candidatus Omnitrophica bacterium]|nr:NAD(P)-dependent oxidoreductase [Candidatus Omnitrophota bacterium]